MTENHSEEQKGNGFINGLIIGAILGGAAVFFLGTQKGKKLLKVITEEGMDSISNIKDMMEDDFEEELEGPEMVPSEEFEEEIEAKNNNDSHHGNGHTHHAHGHSKKSPPHRFFKKPAKKS